MLIEIILACTILDCAQKCCILDFYKKLTEFGARNFHCKVNWAVIFNFFHILEKKRYIDFLKVFQQFFSISQQIKNRTNDPLLLLPKGFTCLEF